MFLAIFDALWIDMGPERVQHVLHASRDVHLDAKKNV